MTNTVPRENLWFLSRPVPDTSVSAGYKNSLVVMKAGEAGVAYGAFNSAPLADLFKHGRKDRSVISAVDLDSDDFHAFGEQQVLLFASEQDVKRFYASAGTFPYTDHLYYYSLAEGLSKS